MGMQDDDMMGGEGGDYSDDDDEGMPISEDLPEGVTKDIVKDAEQGDYKKPKIGDDVTIHYVGTLESDGSEVVSSRSGDKPLTFQLGKGRFIKGLDLGIATMKKGEVSKFTLAPEFASGPEGFAAKVPENATVVYEVELLSWVVKEDLFNDDGVVKTILEEAKTGWKTPKDGDELLISLKATARDGSLIEEKVDFEYTLGSESLGPLGRAVDKALTGMKKGELSSLECTSEYSYGEKHPEGIKIELSFSELFETKDVSFNKDKSVMKKQVKEGTDWDTPKDASKVKLVVEGITDGHGATLAGFTAPVTLDFTSGNGDVCDAIECAVGEMKAGERAIVTVSKTELCGGAELGCPDLQKDRSQITAKFSEIVLTMSLESFEKAKDTWSMSEEEKVAFALSRKEVGGSLFKSGRIDMALHRYKKVVELFNYVDNFKDEDNKKKALELKRLCELNRAACCLKMLDFDGAKTSCDAVLKDERDNVKALFRRANAYYGRADNAEALADLNRVLELDEANSDAKGLMLRVKRARKEEDKKSKSMYAKMCGGLGKLGTPAATPAGKENSELANGDADADAVDSKAPGTGEEDAQMES